MKPDYLNDPLAQDVKQIAIKLCSDYPDIEKVGPREALYAIEQGYEGIKLANEDLHLVLDFIRKEKNMTCKEFADWMQETVKFKKAIGGKPYQD